MYTDIVFCGDRSGSMRQMGASPQKGTRNFLTKHRDLAKELKSKGDCNYILELTTFDDVSETSVFEDASKISDIDLSESERAMRPRGQTRLYDTAIECVERQQKRVDAFIGSLPSESCDLVRSNGDATVVIFALMTDGQDNASIVNVDKMNEAVREHRDSYGATCLFLAANQDAITTGQRFGFSGDTCLQMGNTYRTTMAAISSATQSTSRCVSGYSPAFTFLERQVSCADAGIKYPSSPMIRSSTTINQIIPPPPTNIPTLQETKCSHISNPTCQTCKNPEGPFCCDCGTRLSAPSCVCTSSSENDSEVDFILPPPPPLA